jgi:hypothetical protein
VSLPQSGQIIGPVDPMGAEREWGGEPGRCVLAPLSPGCDHDLRALTCSLIRASLLDHTSNVFSAVVRNVWISILSMLMSSAMSAPVTRCPVGGRLALLERDRLLERERDGERLSLRASSPRARGCFRFLEAWLGAGDLLQLREPFELEALL